MSSKGTIATWNDQKGFGFISSVDGGERVFVHISAFKHRTRRPAVGDVVTYSVSADRQGRPRAEAAAIAGATTVARPDHTTRAGARPRSGSRSKASTGTLAQLTAAVFLLVVAAAALVSAVPMSVLALYVFVSIVTFAAYALDKSAARRGAWRTSEATLHLLAIGGGWPGALVAQSRLRHKSKKQPFRAIFWITVAINCAALGWLLTPEGTRVWQSMLR